MQIGCAIPRLRQRFCYWRSPPEEYLQPHAVICKIGERNNNLTPNPECFPNNSSRRNQFLKCPQQEDIIERLLAVLIQTFGDVSLMHHQSPLNALGNQNRALFHALGLDASRLNQPFQECAVTRAQIQHARAGRYPFQYTLVNSRMHNRLNSQAAFPEIHGSIFIVQIMAHNAGELRILDQK